MSSKKEKPVVRVINRNDPINSLSVEERALAKKLGLTGETGPHMRKKQLPPRWREVVFAVCSRPFTNAQLAHALGISRRSVQHRLADPKDPLTEAVEVARGAMFSVIVDPMYETLLKDKGEDTFALRQWFAQRVFADQFNPNVQANQRPAVTVNVGVALPTPQKYAEFVKVVRPSGSERA